jgi:signal peptidase I
MKFTNIKYIVFVLLLSFSLHKYYVSITEVVHNSEANTLEISSRFFINDLNDALQNSYTKNYELGTAKELEDTDDKLKLYFLSHFKIQINEKWLPIKFIGKDFDGYDVVYCYFEVATPKNIDKITIINTSLIELFPEQENLIKLNISGIQNSMKLTKRQQEDSVNY